MKSLALFNNKGGVGKTTLTVNISDSLAELGHTVLMVDADPQCNLSSFFLPEKNLDTLLDASDSDEGETLWSAIRPVVRGKGGIKEIEPVKITPKEYLVPGDVFLADYEEELPEAWTSAFARKERGYDVTCAFSHAVRDIAMKIKADVILYDVGPNLGPLNRAVLLDADFFATPVAADLFFSARSYYCGPLSFSLDRGLGYRTFSCLSGKSGGAYEWSPCFFGIHHVGL